MPDRLRFISAALLVAVLGAASFARSAVYQDEITLLSDTARKSPDKVRLLNNLAFALMSAGRNQDALPLLKRALDLDPQFTDAWNNLALTYFSVGMWTEAEQEFQLIIERRPYTRDADFARKMIALIRKSAGPGQH